MCENITQAWRENWAWKDTPLILIFWLNLPGKESNGDWRKSQEEFALSSVLVVCLVCTLIAFGEVITEIIKAK